LLHISQISHERIAKVTDVLAEGQIVRVKVLETDEKGRVKLSMKALMERPAGDHQGAEHHGERHSNHQHADEAQQQQQQQQ
jgi:polyribonucleotide nucleotidyltransferase